jgi:RNA polymerase sigma factor (sigma-70 family)
MTEPIGSVTRLIPEVQRRDELAILALWRRYGLRIENLARPMLMGVSPGVGDAEDVAQSAFHAFCHAAADGHAAQLADRDDLWRLLATISRRKATDRIRRELRTRRGGHATTLSCGLENAEDDLPSPADAVMLRDQLDRLFQEMDATGDAKLRMIAQMRLEGSPNEEIAAQLGCTARTVQRKLHIVERLWRQQTN